MKPDLDAIRARWPEGRLANTAAREDVLALLAYVEELESRVTYTVGETEWANRIAHAEQRFADEYDAHQETRALLTGLRHREVMLKRAHGALTDAGCVVPIELDKTIEHAINALAERALTAEERLERVTHERDQERTVFEQAMAEAQTDNMHLRASLKVLADLKVST